MKAVQREVGTVCSAHQSSGKERQQWLSSGNIVRGKVKIKESALTEINHGGQLFNHDIAAVIEPFAKGEVFEILDINDRSVAVARSLESSEIVIPKKSPENNLLAHSDEIILL